MNYKSDIKDTKRQYILRKYFGAFFKLLPVDGYSGNGNNSNKNEYSDLARNINNSNCNSNDDNNNDNNRYDDGDKCKQQQ